MYVPGKLSDVERVLIDVGTGYYVEKVRGVREGHCQVWGGWLGAFPGELLPMFVPRRPPLTPLLLPPSDSR